METWFNPEMIGGNWGLILLGNLKARPGLEEQFRTQFAELIAAESLDPKSYEEITTHVLPDQEHVNDHLRRLWEWIYGDEPIPGDPHRYED